MYIYSEFHRWIELENDYDKSKAEKVVYYVMRIRWKVEKKKKNFEKHRTSLQQSFVEIWFFFSSIAFRKAQKTIFCFISFLFIERREKFLVFWWFGTFYIFQDFIVTKEYNENFTVTCNGTDNCDEAVSPSESALVTFIDAQHCLGSIM